MDKPAAAPNTAPVLEIFHSQLRQIERRANIVLLMQILLTLITATFCIIMLATHDSDNSTITLYSSILSWVLGWWIQSPMGGSAKVAGMGGGGSLGRGGADDSPNNPNVQLTQALSSMGLGPSMSSPAQPRRSLDTNQKKPPSPPSFVSTMLAASPKHSIDIEMGGKKSPPEKKAQVSVVTLTPENEVPLPPSPFSTALHKPPSPSKAADKENVKAARNLSLDPKAGINAKKPDPAPAWTVPVPPKVKI